MGKQILWLDHIVLMSFYPLSNPFSYLKRTTKRSAVLVVQYVTFNQNGIAAALGLQCGLDLPNDPILLRSTCTPGDMDAFSGPRGPWL